MKFIKSAMIDNEILEEIKRSHITCAVRKNSPQKLSPSLEVFVEKILNYVKLTLATCSG